MTFQESIGKRLPQRMVMANYILLVLAGLALIVAGGNYLTDGAVLIAKKLKVSPLVIGLTVVAIGSSAPDLVVCVLSSVHGHSPIALGDVVGANIFDLLLVVGVVSMINPIEISRDLRRNGLPMVVLSSIALLVCGDDKLFDHRNADIISRTDGMIFLLLFVVFMTRTIDLARKQESAPEPTETSDAQIPARKVWLAALTVAASLAALFVGGDWLVDGASGIARHEGLSEGLIGLTIVGFGSSVPDLLTSIIAAVKKQPGIALGNVLGACVFNVFFILGLCATIYPIDTDSITAIDFCAMVIGSLCLWISGCALKRKSIGRAEGLLLILLYLAYAVRIVLAFQK